jgi:hypothetical protein
LVQPYCTAFLFLFVFLFIFIFPKKKGPGADNEHKPPFLLIRRKPRQKWMSMHFIYNLRQGDFFFFFFFNNRVIHLH